MKTGKLQYVEIRFAADILLLILLLSLLALPIASLGISSVASEYPQVAGVTTLAEPKE